ncbi:hypothetical protein Ae201684P_011322 [Aphanomyces euteiches]|nr:hypothetical protein Ae201684P_011322 [Aphanomyces euteiches]
MLSRAVVIAAPMKNLSRALGPRAASTAGALIGVDPSVVATSQDTMQTTFSEPLMEAAKEQAQTDIWQVVFGTYSEVSRD